MAVFAIIGALDKIFGNKLKLGDEFEKGLLTLGPLSLSMLGMMTIAPVLADLLVPVISPVAKLFHFDPSALAGILIANDMGGASLADSIANDSVLGAFHGLCVAAMLGATISFTIPVALRSTLAVDLIFILSVRIDLLCECQRSRIRFESQPRRFTVGNLAWRG
jgi:ethanolamine transporter